MEELLQHEKRDHAAEDEQPRPRPLAERLVRLGDEVQQRSAKHRADGERDQQEHQPLQPRRSERERDRACERRQRDERDASQRVNPGAHET